MTDERIDLSIVLPCYNEAASLPALLEAYRDAWSTDLSVELLLVDNGSTDETPEVLARACAAATDGWLRSVRVEKNRGYGHGIMTGLRAARGEVLAYSHADMQCPPADLFVAYRKLLEAPDIEKVLVKGRRGRRPFSAAVVTHVMGFVASLILRMKLWDINAQPKLFHRSLLDQLEDPPDGFELDLFVLHQARRSGRELVTIPVSFEPRVHGESKWAATLFSRYRTILRVLAYIPRLALRRSRSAGSAAEAGA